MTELYVTGVVIANGVPDSDGDVLNKQDIKKIFTKYTIQQTDVQHNYIRNEGVDILENWITRTPSIIGGKQVPSGSWLCTSKVTNSDIAQLIFDGKLTSYSLGSTPKDNIIDENMFIEKGLTYSQVNDIDEVIPLFISFVSMGANGYTFEVMSYDAYINKNVKSKEIENMSEEKVEVVDEKVSIGGLQKIRDILGISKSTSVDEEPKQEVKVEEVKEEKVDGFDKEEFLSSIREEVSTGVVEGFKEILKNNNEAEEKDEKEDKEDEEEKVDEKVEVVNEDKKINKKQTQKLDNVTQPNESTNFYKMSGRDEFGCKIRK